MKLSSTLLQAIACGIAVSPMSSSCQQNDVNSGRTKETQMNTSKNATSGKKEFKRSGDHCPACGMG